MTTAVRYATKNKFFTVKGFPVYALFLKDLAAKKVNLPTAFMPRARACAKLWRTTIKGKAKTLHYKRAKAIVWRRRARCVWRKFPGFKRFYERKFAKYVRTQTTGKKGRVPDFKKLAAAFNKAKGKK